MIPAARIATLIWALTNDLASASALALALVLAQSLSVRPDYLVEVMCEKT